MKNGWISFAIVLFALTNVETVFCTPAKNSATFSVSKVLLGNLEYVESSVVPAAEAMSDDKYSFAPTNGEFKGVRNYGQLVKHIAVWNYKFGASILEEKVPVEIGGENGPDSLNSKAEIVKFLKGSFAYLRKAIGAISQKNQLLPIKAPWGGSPVTRLGMAVSGIDHPFDIYGQMVEYLRMNGIVPPASR